MRKLNRLIFEELRDLQDGVGDKYAERAAGIPDTEEKDYLRQTSPAVQTPEMGQLIGYAKTGPFGSKEYNPEEPIFKNPKSLDKFDSGVRAVTDRDGNVYVAQHDGDFVHVGFEGAVNTYNVYDINFGLTWQRIGKTNKFGLSDSSTIYPQMTEPNIVKFFNQQLENLEDNLPQFEFVPEFYFGVNEGVGDKYAEKKWGIEDKGRVFSDKYSRRVRAERPANPENGEMVAQIRYDDGELAANIFKNPKTFKNFDNNVRAVTDHYGDLYIADTDGPFFHDVFSVVDIDAYNYSQNIQWHKYNDEDRLCYSISFMTQAANEDPLTLEERFETARRRNPTITFEEEYCGDLGQYLNERLYKDVYSGVKALVEGVDMLSENLQVYTMHDLAQMLHRLPDMNSGTVNVIEKMLQKEYQKGGDQAVINLYQQFAGVQIEAVRNGRYVFDLLTGGGSPQLEGVGDKYAEKKFGIPDEDKKYQSMGVPDSNMGERITDVWGREFGGEGVNYGPIYKNPKTLNGFDEDVRAIALEDGTLYVAQHDGSFIHVEMELVLEKVIGPLGEYYEFHRVGTSNVFGASDTLIHKIQDYNADGRGMVEILNNKFPQFEFSTTYYEYLKNSDEYAVDYGANFDEGVGDKYAARAGLPDEDAAFEKAFRRSNLKGTKDSANGELVASNLTKYELGQFDEDDVEINIPVNVYKNPTSLANFEPNVRAFNDGAGNIFVAQIDGDFMHDTLMSIWKGIEEGNLKYLELYRIGNTDVFGLSHYNAFEYNKVYVMDRGAESKDRKNIREAIQGLNRKQPRFTFLPFDSNDLWANKIPQKDIDVVKSELDIHEGVGDKYLERSKGIADPDQEFEKKFQAHTKTQSQDSRNGTPDGEIVNKNNQVIKIYKNPTSLVNFDPEVRAVSDREGNVYVAQLDGDFYHREISQNIQEDIGAAYDVENNITWHRVGTTETFGFSISYINDFRYQMSGPGAPEEQAKIKKINDRHPTLTFAPFYWHDLQRGLITDDVYRNIMQVFGR